MSDLIKLAAFLEEQADLADKGLWVGRHNAPAARDAFREAAAALRAIGLKVEG